MITDIAWDFDGTLCDSYPLITYSFQMALEKVGVHVSTQEVRKWVTITVPEAAAHFHQLYDFDLPGMMQLFRQRNEQIDYERVIPFPGVDKALEQVIAYGGRNHLYTHRLSTSVLQYLEHYGLRKYFTIELTADKGFPRKPDPTALLTLMGKGNIKAEHLLMVGDRPIDIDAAFNAHAASCFFNSNHLPRPIHATYAVDTYPEFCVLLGRLMKG
ncbi:MAG: HAD hydrolase-like protein [Sphaerochaetaceae bacterium]|nr:HAD hydrolase-like protein [Spirochaetales bacterium]MDY5499809.1 HAD hydrolase-like protein [Sphaerochaetaceae bacterium]